MTCHHPHLGHLGHLGDSPARPMVWNFYPEISDGLPCGHAISSYNISRAPAPCSPPALPYTITFPAVALFVHPVAPRVSSYCNSVCNLSSRIPYLLFFRRAAVVNPARVLPAQTRPSPISSSSRTWKAGKAGSTKHEAREQPLHPLSRRARPLHRAQFCCYMSPQSTLPSYIFTGTRRRLAFGKDGSKV